MEVVNVMWKCTPTFIVSLSFSKLRPPNVCTLVFEKLSHSEEHEMPEGPVIYSVSPKVVITTLNAFIQIKIHRYKFKISETQITAD
jgi:hypothetical protein